MTKKFKLANTDDAQYRHKDNNCKILTQHEADIKTMAKTVGNKKTQAFKKHEPCPQCHPKGQQKTIEDGLRERAELTDLEYHDYLSNLVRGDSYSLEEISEFTTDSEEQKVRQNLTSETEQPSESNEIHTYYKNNDTSTTLHPDKECHHLPEEPTQVTIDNVDTENICGTCGP